MVLFGRDQRILAYTLLRDRGILTDGTGYDIEWYLGCVPWLLTVKGIGYDSVKAAITSFINDGVTALEDSEDWQQFDFRNCYCNRGDA